MELESVSEISSPRLSSVYECQSVECAFTSPVIIQLGMLVMYCMQFVMSVSVVSMVSWCFLVLCSAPWKGSVMKGKSNPIRKRTINRKYIYIYMLAMVM